MTFPATVLHTEVETLLAQLRGARDADVEAVHAARVATRRLRETLPLFSRSHPGDVARVKRLVRRAGRRLGRVRQLDVMDADLLRRTVRMPMATHAVGVARTKLASRRASELRRMIKLFDRLNLERKDQLRIPQHRDVWHPLAGTHARGWPNLLRTRIARRVDDLRRAIDHAGGVYFPNRLHAVRVAAKKLRYSVELAALGGLWRSEEAVVELKRSQDTLGRLHDAQMLLESLGTLVRAEADRRQVAMLKDDLKGEIVERHAKYLLQRHQLREASQACADGANAGRSPRHPYMPLVALSAVAVPAGLLYVGAGER